MERDEFHGQGMIGILFIEQNFSPNFGNNLGPPNLLENDYVVSLLILGMRPYYLIPLLMHISLEFYLENEDFKGDVIPTPLPLTLPYNLMIKNPCHMNIAFNTQMISP